MKKSEELEKCTEVIDKFIEDNADTSDIIIARYEIKKVLDNRINHYEKERERMIEYRLKQKGTLCI